MERIAVYIDGFNLYHAIDDLKTPHYKWLNLCKLAKLLISQKSQRIVLVMYFSAYANHFGPTPEAYKLLRHRSYVEALRAKGVICHMGNFAKRDRYFAGRGYKAKWTRYEEKQTDVAIGTYLIDDAYQDAFDRALVICVDTDILPAFDIMRLRFPAKPVVCVAPPRRSHHRDIQSRAGGLDVIKVSQIEKALFGVRVVSKGKVVSSRPRAYQPPS